LKWCYGKYANDYIKIDGKWYLWHKKWLRGFSCAIVILLEGFDIQADGVSAPRLTLAFN
jgi:hypothetical protein